MPLSGWLALLRLPNSWAQIRVQGDTSSFIRLHFLNAAYESGVLAVLRTPHFLNEVASSLGVTRPDLLEALLDLGVSLGELSSRGGRYRLRGSCAWALSTGDAEPLAALVWEVVTLHGDAYRHLPERLKGASLGSYLQGTGPKLAWSSRVLEPFIAPFARSAVKVGRPVRLLEVGCGSGVYLRHAAEANPELTGVAIDMQADVVDQARANLSRWGFSDRFSVSVADIRRPTADLDGPFDVITLYNNIYYFQVEERVPLLRSLRSRLAPDGKLALVSFMKDRTSRTSSLNFDVFLRSTSGCGPLPGLKELIDQLRESGFSEVSTAQLLPREALYGIVAKSGAQYSRHDNDT